MQQNNKVYQQDFQQGNTPQRYPDLGPSPQYSSPQGYPQQQFQQPMSPQNNQAQGFPPQTQPGGYPQQGFPQQGYPQQGLQPQGFPQQGFQPQGYPQQGYQPPNAMLNPNGYMPVPTGNPEFNQELQEINNSLQSKYKCYDVLLKIFFALQCFGILSNFINIFNVGPAILPGLVLGGCIAYFYWYAIKAFDTKNTTNQICVSKGFFILYICAIIGLIGMIGVTIWMGIVATDTPSCGPNSGASCGVADFLFGLFIGVDFLMFFLNILPIRYLWKKSVEIVDLFKRKDMLATGQIC